jgi:hypothetical protein
MKVKNNTLYSTRRIRSVLCAVHSEVARAEGRLPRWKRVTFEIVNTIRGGSGYAHRYGTYARLRLPGLHNTRPCNYDTLIRLGWHELLHLYGYEQKHLHTRRAWNGRSKGDGPALTTTDRICAKLGVHWNDPLPKA